MINPEAEIIFEPLPSDDPRRRRPDISKAKSLLNWEPTIELNEGLKSTIEYFKQRRSAIEALSKL
jgi:UDP-glucuronate decarboxylase